MNQKSASFFEKHPTKTLLFIWLFIFALAGVFGEVYLRTSIKYDIGYYAASRDEGILKYPFGEIPINSDGNPDAEFDLNDPRPRVGYLGDSVNYGIGAGYGYRFSDILEKQYPNYQHMTMGQVGFGIHDVDLIDHLLEKYDFNTIIYLMNLNDILPFIDFEHGDENTTFLSKIKLIVKGSVDYFRDKSYLYNYLRTTIQTVLMKHGLDDGGHESYELYPEKYKDIFEGTAKRTNAFSDRLASEGKKFCIIILPYEMQISDEAAAKYKSLGFHWAEDFTSGSAQKLIMSYLDTDKYEVLDGYNAFVDPANPEQSKTDNGLSEYFVYNRGDRIDWNHPTRAGHKKLAEYAISKGFCGLK